MLSRRSRQRDFEVAMEFLVMGVGNCAIHPQYLTEGVVAETQLSPEYVEFSEQLLTFHEALEATYLTRGDATQAITTVSHWWSVSLGAAVESGAIRSDYPLFRLVEKFKDEIIELLEQKAASQPILFPWIS